MIRRRGDSIQTAMLAGIASVLGGVLFALIACALLSVPVSAARPPWFPLLFCDDEADTLPPTAASQQSVSGTRMERGTALPFALSWSADPSQNLAVSTAPDNQTYEVAISDGAGGMIVAWQDARNYGASGWDIYAQHVLGCGLIDPAWPEDGVALCRSPVDERYPVMVSDGSGGAIVAWATSSGASGADIFAQHLLSSGAVDPVWPPDGLGVCTATGRQDLPKITSDGDHGAFLAWDDARVSSFLVPGGGGSIGSTTVTTSSNFITAGVKPGMAIAGTGIRAGAVVVSITSATSLTASVPNSGAVSGSLRFTLQRRVFVQHVLSSGADPDPYWQVNGIALCPGVAFPQRRPVICSDGAGGAIIAWNDDRDFAKLGRRDIYAQRMSVTGALLWSPDGQLCSAAPGSRQIWGHQLGNQTVLLTSAADGQANAIVPDGSGGFFLAWTDWRDAVATEADVYAQHLTASGAVAAGWDPNGVALCRALGPQSVPTILADGAGGAIATWSEDYFTGRPGALAQHVTAAGVVDGPADGLLVSTAGVPLGPTQMVSDGSGGAVLVWADDRNYASYGSSDVFAQRVRTSPSFAVDPGWPPDGAPVSVGPGDQWFSHHGGAVSDGAGGAISAWSDYRNAELSATDIYAQAVLVTGQLPLGATITGPASGAVFPVNTPVNFTGTFTDHPGATHTAQWTFDGLPAVPGTVNEAAQTVSRSHTFTTAGVYSVTLTVTNDCGASGTATQVGGMDAMVVIYDPNAGFVTGGGWINSPLDAFAADPTLTGKANFGFVSKYQKGKSTPTGETEFQFKVASLDFHSSVYEWLVISGARAQYKGSGTINGAGNYGFLLTAIDGQIAGGGGTDKFRMKIIDKSTSAVVYDNQMGMSDDGNATTVLGGGSIIIHVTGAASATALSPDPGGIPAPSLEYALSPNEPNPFRVTSEIRYSLPERSGVKLELYDLAGRRMRSLVDEAMEAGTHSATLTRWDSRGNPLLEGVFFLRMTASSLESGARFTTTRKVTVVR